MTGFETSFGYCKCDRICVYSDPETLSTTRIAAQLRDNIKRKKKKDLPNELDRISVLPHKVSLSSKPEGDTRLQEFKKEVELKNMLLKYYKEVHEASFTAELRVDREITMFSKKIFRISLRTTNDMKLI